MPPTTTRDDDESAVNPLVLHPGDSSLEGPPYPHGQVCFRRRPQQQQETMTSASSVMILHGKDDVARKARFDFTNAPPRPLQETMTSASLSSIGRTTFPERRFDKMRGCSTEHVAGDIRIVLMGRRTRENFWCLLTFILFTEGGKQVYSHPQLMQCM